MANIDAKEVGRLAALAMLALNDDETDNLVKDFQNIFSMIEEINAFDTEGVVPTAQVTGLNHVVRADEEKDYSVTPEELLKGPKEVEGDSIKVARVQ